MLFDIYDKKTEEHTILQIPGCELAQEEMKKRAEILCPHNCWRREEETIYLPNGKEKGMEWRECPFHLRQPPFCGIIRELLGRYQRNSAGIKCKKLAMDEACEYCSHKFICAQIEIKLGIYGKHKWTADGK